MLTDPCSVVFVGGGRILKCTDCIQPAVQRVIVGVTLYQSACLDLFFST